MILAARRSDAPTPSLRHPDRLFIDGEWIAPVVDSRIEVISPDDEKVVIAVAEAGVEDVNKAVAAARRAFDHGPWPRMKPSERIEALQRLAAEIEKREPEIACAWSLQMGGLKSFSGFIAAGGAANLTHTLAIAQDFPFERQAPSKAAAAAIVVQEPVGVVAAITPWNSPYALMMSKLSPALVAGCTVIIKPSPETPTEAYIVAECVEAAGLPPGVFNLITADREASDFLVRHPDVDKVSFTGSTAIGRRIASVCAERVARCTLELGGKSAAIMLDDFPIDEAAALLTRTITTPSGQVCSMLSRAIVPRALHDQLAAAIAEQMKQVKVGYSDDPETQMGPIPNKRQLERVEGYIRNGVEEGAILVTGGGRPKHLNHGYFIEPTLFANVDNSMTIAREEIFGPVLSLIPHEGVDDAIRIANDTIYGLNNSVLTKNVKAAYYVGRSVRSGKFAQNGLKVDFTLPTGGFKQSGIGREGGKAGLEEYLEPKVLLLDGLPSLVVA
jgi:acyl-CoA reductase-like NAD-dependent aldehyde dehydrogenase